MRDEQAVNGGHLYIRHLKPWEGYSIYIVYLSKIFWRKCIIIINCLGVLILFLDGKGVNLGTARSVTI